MGGDPERRGQFPLESSVEFANASPPGFAVSIKLNSADFQRGGFTEDESKDVLASLAGEGLDLIEISGGSYETPAMMGSASDSTRAREAYFLEYARTVRQVVGDVPLAVTGGFRTRDGMASAVSSADCDVVGLGRPTATTTDSASVILGGRADSLVVHEPRVGLRPLIGRVADLKQLDGLLDLGWHVDQLHRLADGREPDLDRGRLAAMIALIRRGGTGAFERRRG